MFLIEQLLRGAVLPGLTALIVLVLVWQPWRCAVCPSLPRGAPLALGLGFFTGYWALIGMPRLPALEAEGWLPWIALAAGLLGLQPERVSAINQWLPALLLSAATAWLTLKPRIQPGMEGFWEQGNAAVYISLFALAIFSGWVLLAQLARRIKGPALPAGYLLAATAASFALLMTHSGKLAQFAGIVAACCGALAFIAVFQPHLGSSIWLAGSFWLLYCGLLLGGHFYSGLDLLPALLLAVAPLAVWLVAAPASQRGRWIAAALTAVCVVAAGLGALGLIQLEERRDTAAAGDSDEIDYEDYYY